MLLDLERPRPAVLDRVTEAMERSHTGIATPGEDQAFRAATPDHLVVDEIGRHPNQRQVGQPLADDLVAGGERDEVREPFERNGIARRNEPRHGVLEGEEFSHGWRIVALALARMRGPYQGVNGRTKDNPSRRTAHGLGTGCGLVQTDAHPSTRLPITSGASVAKRWRVVGVGPHDN